MADSFEKFITDKSFGQGSNRYVSSSDNLVTIDAYAIKAIEETVFTSLAETGLLSATTMATKTLSAGDTIYGKFTSVRISSGFIKVYGN